MKRISLGVAVLFIISVLAYGYWFGVTHGSLYITVLDVTDREHSKDTRPVQLVFRDGAGKVLGEAEAAGPEQIGAITVSSPSTYTCHEIERRASTSIDARGEWATCFERQSRWLPTWVRDVRSVDLQTTACSIPAIPTTVSEHPDIWWLWWVPLRHIGGKPYTFFSFLITFSRNSCT